MILLRAPPKIGEDIRIKVEHATERFKRVSSMREQSWAIVRFYDNRITPTRAYIFVVHRVCTYIRGMEKSVGISKLLFDILMGCTRRYLIKRTL